jgi:hypothetical protein
MQSSKENNNNSPKIAMDKTNETKNLSSVGHCWRAALLAAFRLIWIT